MQRYGKAEELTWRSHLCRQEEYYSTVKGAREYNRWRPHPAARSQGDRRRLAFLLLDKRPFQSSAYWWTLRQGFCTARTSQLKASKIPSQTSAWQKSMFSGIIFTMSAAITHWGWFIGLTDTLGQPLAPLWRGRISVVAGKQTVSRQYVAFVADKLHRRAHGEAVSFENSVTVRHVSRILTRQN